MFQYVKKSSGLKVLCSCLRIDYSYHVSAVDRTSCITTQNTLHDKWHCRARMKRVAPRHSPATVQYGFSGGLFVCALEVGARCFAPMARPIMCGCSMGDLSLQLQEDGVLGFQQSMVGTGRQSLHWQLRRMCHDRRMTRAGSSSS